MKAHYFDHDYNARNDQKILQLRFEHGLEGYGTFWCLIETMAEDTTGYIAKSSLGGLSVGYGLAIDRLQNIVKTCIDVGLFYETEDKKFFSERIISHKKQMEEYTENGRIGAEKRWSNRGAIGGGNAEGNAIKEEKTRINNTKRKLIKEKFAPPTLEEFKAYCKENGYENIAERAYRYYSESGWKDSQGKQVRSWKAKLQAVWFRPENSQQNSTGAINGTGKAGHPRDSEEISRIREKYAGM